jgi:hypothetical protein
MLSIDVPSECRCRHGHHHRGRHKGRRNPQTCALNHPISFPFLTHPTSMKLKLRCIGCEFAGAGRLVCVSTKLQTSVRPLALVSSFLTNPRSSPPLPFSSPFPKNKTGQRSGFAPSLDGCTTGSVCPIGTHLRRTEFFASTAGLLLFPNKRIETERPCACAIRHMFEEDMQARERTSDGVRYLELPLFTDCRERAFSETKLPVQVILGNWASRKQCSRKLSCRF